MRQRVVITGLGVVAPNGIGKDFENAMFGGRSGISKITAFDDPKCPVKIAGEIKNFEPLDYVPTATFRKTDRFVHLGLAAAKLAIEDSRIEANKLENAAVIIGSGQGGLSFHEQTIIRYLENGTKRASANIIPKIASNAVSAHIAMEYKIYGMNYVVSTACSSGSQAVGQAFRNIQCGFCDVAITGGVEATISPVMLAMYDVMTALSRQYDEPEKASRPFDFKRDGFVLSEGAAMLILEPLDEANKRGAQIYAEIIGFGSNCGAYHMATPEPSGVDAARAITAALKDADTKPEDVDYINAHGTSTKQNDLAETKAVKVAFGEHAHRIPISSIKSMVGHTIGAAGAIEVAACCLSIKRKLIPPTINLDNPDPECDLDYVPNVSRKADVKIAISNSFGFGSNNAVLVLRDLR